jgi:hypothetical protein
MGPRTSSTLPIGVYTSRISICVRKMAVVIAYLVLEEYWGVEVGDFWIYGLADHFAFTCVHEGSHCCYMSAKHSLRPRSLLYTNLISQQEDH